MATDPRKEGSNAKIPSESFQAKSNHFTHFYVSYLNLDSFREPALKVAPPSDKEKIKQRCKHTGKTSTAQRAVNTME